MLNLRTGLNTRSFGINLFRGGSNHRLRFGNDSALVDTCHKLSQLNGNAEGAPTNLVVNPN